MKNLLLFLPVCTLCLLSCDNIEDTYVTERPYSIDWHAVADSSTNTLTGQFWNASEGYFNYENDGANTAFHYAAQAHAMDVIIDACLRTDKAEYQSCFDTWYTGIKRKNGDTYLSSSYEDMEWMALTMLRLYEVTKEDKYIQTAVELWNEIVKGWNNSAGGGIALNTEEKLRKNASSNGPATILAARLYSHTQNEEYKTWALKIYEWEKDHLFDPASGGVYASLDGETGHVTSTTLSYNQGSFLGAAYELYKITADDFYLLDARRAAHYGVKNPGMLDTGNNVIRDEGKGDAALYKGIFMRYLTQLILEDNVAPAYKELFTIFLNNNANVLWRRGVDKNYLLYSSNWTQVPGRSTQLTSQISGCMTIEAKAYYEKMKK